MKQLRQIYIPLIISIVAIVFSAPVASAYSFMENGLCYNINSDQTTVTVTYEQTTTPRYANLSGSLVIPETVTHNNTTYSVTAISNNAFTGCTGLTEVVIPKSVASVGSSVFKGCSGLNTVNWNAKSCNDFSSTTSSQPFYGLTSLSSILFGNEVEKIPSYLCYQLSGLTGDIIIPNSVQTIGNSAFRNCSNFASLVIGKEVKTIGSSVFTGCNSLTHVYWNAISCDDFTSTSSSQPFNGLTSLSALTFGDEVNIIPAFLCYQLSNLTGELLIPNSVISINKSAFYGCSSLTGSLVIPNSVTTIGDLSFSNCTGLTSITIPQSTTAITSTAFSGCSNIAAVDFNAPLFNIDLSSASITSLHFGEHVNDISGKIKGELDELTIPTNVMTIGRGVFKECKVENVIIEDGVTQLNNDYASYTSSSGYGSGASYHNTFNDSSTKYLYIGRDTKNRLVGGSSNNYTVTEIVINGNITAMESGCTKLEKITFYNTITSLPTSGFSSAKVIRDVYANWADPPTIKESFFTTEAYSNGILHVPYGTKSVYEARTGWKNFTIVDDLNNEEPQNETITSLSLTPSGIEMVIGETYTITANITPENATNKTLIWASSNDNVVSVNSNGVVEALSVGNAIISATTTDGSELTSQCQIIVTEPQDNNLYGLCINAGNFVLGNINEEVILPVIFRSSNSITGLSFTICLPEYVELVDDINSFLIVNEYAEGFSFSASQNNDGTITINGTSSNPLSSGEGTLIRLKVKATRQGTYNIPITDINFTTADGYVKNLSHSITKLIILGIRGDLNGDGFVNGSDVTLFYNIILTQ